MKVKLTKAQIEKIVQDPDAAASAGLKVSDPWWLIVVKVISYVCGLILAGAATAGCVRVI